MARISGALMSDEEERTLPDMMEELRRLQRKLEKLFAENIRKFEDMTGLTVDGIELIHTTNAEMSNKRITMRIAAVKLDVRL